MNNQYCSSVKSGSLPIVSRNSRMSEILLSLMIALLERGISGVSSWGSGSAGGVGGSVGVSEDCEEDVDSGRPMPSSDKP